MIIEESSVVTALPTPDAPTAPIAPERRHTIQVSIREDLDEVIDGIVAFSGRTREDVVDDVVQSALRRLRAKALAESAKMFTQ